MTAALAYCLTGSSLVAAVALVDDRFSQVDHVFVAPYRVPFNRNRGGLVARDRGLLRIKEHLVVRPIRRHWGADLLVREQSRPVV